MLKALDQVDPGTFVLCFSIFAFVMTIIIAEFKGRNAVDNDGEGPHFTDFSSNNDCRDGGAEGFDCGDGGGE